jgi:hypothetical protein
MPDKKQPKQPGEVPPPDQNPEVRPDYAPEAPLLPEEDPGIQPPKQPDNPWPEKEPTPPQPSSGSVGWVRDGGRRWDDGHSQVDRRWEGWMRYRGTQMR